MADKNFYVFDNSFAPTKDISVPCCGLNSNDLPSQRKNISRTVSYQDLCWYPNISPALSHVTTPVHNPLESSPVISLQEDHDCDLPATSCFPLEELLSSRETYSLQSKPKSFIELKTSLSNLNNYLKKRYANFTSKKSCNRQNSSCLPSSSKVNAQKYASHNKPDHGVSCTNEKNFSQDIKSLSCPHSKIPHHDANYIVRKSAMKVNQNKEKRMKRIGGKVIAEDIYISEYHPTHEEDNTSFFYVILPYLVMGSILLALMV